MAARECLNVYVDAASGKCINRLRYFYIFPRKLNGASSPLKAEVCPKGNNVIFQPLIFRGDFLFSEKYTNKKGHITQHCHRCALFHPHNMDALPEASMAIAPENMAPRISEISVNLMNPRAAIKKNRWQIVFILPCLHDFSIQTCLPDACAACKKHMLMVQATKRCVYLWNSLSATKMELLYINRCTTSVRFILSTVSTGLVTYFFVGLYINCPRGQRIPDSSKWLFQWSSMTQVKTAFVSPWNFQGFWVEFYQPTCAVILVEAMLVRAASSTRSGSPMGSIKSSHMPKSSTP